MSLPRVAIIIPHFNGKKILSHCLESVFKIGWPNYFVIVVDNGSTDGSQNFIKNNFPQVILIQNEENIGFAGACNQGIKKAFKRDAHYILLLNNDTTVSPDILDKIVDTAQQYKETGIVGAKIYYHDQPKKIWFGGGDFIWWRASGKHRYWQKHDSSKLTGIQESDFITGCCMLIRRAVFNDVSSQYFATPEGVSQKYFFYEPYFLTIEDLDFCYRARNNKWKILVNLDAHIWHKVSGSRLGEFSFSNGYYGTRNRLFFAFKRSNNFIGGLVLLFFVIPIRVVQWSLIGRTGMVKGMILGCLDFFKGKMGKRNNKNLASPEP